MKELKTLAQFASILALAFGLVSCNPENKIEPEPDPIECQQVYFDNADLQEIYLLDGAEGTLTFKVARKKADAAISVPIKAASLDASLGIVVPATVEFAATAKEAEVVVKYPATLPTKQLINIDLELTGDDVDPFLGEGSNTASVQIVVPETYRARTRIYDMNYTIRSEYGQWAQEVTCVTDEWIILKGFLKSDVDVTLKACGKSESSGTNYTHFKVESATAGYSYYYEDYDDYTWYFADGETGEWMTFYPFGKDAWFNIPGCSLLYKVENGPADEYDIYMAEGSTSLYATMTETYYAPDINNCVYYDQLCFTWDVEFDENLPEYVAPVYGDIKVTAYVASAPDVKYESTGSWDGSTFVIDELFELKKIGVIIEDSTFKGFSCSGMSYDSEYLCYMSNNYLRFNDAYKCMYIDYPSSYSYYDAATSTLNLSVYFWVYDSSKAEQGYWSDDDTLVIKIGE